MIFFRNAGVLLIFLILGTADNAWTAQSKNVRPCFMSDLMGTWEMRNVTSKIKIDPKDSFVWPYQRITFDRKGDVKQVTSTTPFQGNQAVIKKFNESASTSKYSIDESSVLSLTKLENPNPERCLCSYVTKNLPAEVLLKLPATKRDQMPHEGDIVLTYMNRGGKPVVIKTFKKI
ncbi:MAG: hypothetical protein AUJ72_05340 [Candidatus Omnitrophica bacterium CG1_02_46_14]|nr:MAG: hypothetical protein AUJ72_05340 [Candidatus Omnitrophica bacterium CG1_02_46_14]